MRLACIRVELPEGLDRDALVVLAKVLATSPQCYELLDHHGAVSADIAVEDNFLLVFPEYEVKAIPIPNGSPRQRYMI